jgi:DNA-directed RNA polymerase specialized sigma24 family protein
VIPSLSDQDREVLLLRRTERLSNQEAAKVLGLTAAAATMRYLHALHHLREELPPATGDAFDRGP